MVIMMLGDWVIPFTYTQGLGGINYTIWPWLIQGIGMALYFESRNLPPEKSDAAPPERQLINHLRFRLPSRGQ
jgi:hypothetical protein